MFVEVSPALAAERGLSTAAGRTWSPRRAAVEARVLVTARLRPLRIDGPDRAPDLAAVPLGRRGLTTGDSANDLFGITLDPNVLIQESKVGTCDIQPGRRPTGQALLAYVAGYLRRAGLDRPTTDTPIVTQRTGS